MPINGQVDFYIKEGVKSMYAIKNMLLGITIILVAIVYTLFIVTGLITNFIAIIGIIFVLIGYFSNSNSDQTKGKVEAQKEIDAQNKRED